jgi:hypothetical protein
MEGKVIAVSPEGGDNEMYTVLHEPTDEVHVP